LPLKERKRKKKIIINQITLIVIGQIKKQSMPWLVYFKKKRMSRMLYEENTDWNAWKKSESPSYYLLDLALDALARTTHNAKLWKIHSALFYFAPSCSSSIFFHTFFLFYFFFTTKRQQKRHVWTCPDMSDSGFWVLNNGN
jgi:hypothetical protein